MPEQPKRQPVQSFASFSLRFAAVIGGGGIAILVTYFIGVWNPPTAETREMVVLVLVPGLVVFGAVLALVKA